MRPRTIDFSGKNSKELGVIVKSVQVGEPQTKTVKIDVPYGNGSIDLTDYFGKAAYSERQLTIDLGIHPTRDHMRIYSRCLNELHGRKHRITLSADQGYYYLARCELGPLSMGDGYWSFSLTAAADPYKYHQNVTTVKASAPAELNLQNDQMPALITVEVETSEVLLEWGDASYGLSVGTHKLTTPLEPGDNPMTLSGAGSVVITYQEGRL